MGLHDQDVLALNAEADTPDGSRLKHSDLDVEEELLLGDQVIEDVQDKRQASVGYHGEGFRHFDEHKEYFTARAG